MMLRNWHSQESYTIVEMHDVGLSEEHMDVKDKEQLHAQWLSSQNMWLGNEQSWPQELSYALVHITATVSQVSISWSSLAGTSPAMQYS